MKSSLLALLLVGCTGGSSADITPDAGGNPVDEHWLDGGALQLAADATDLYVSTGASLERVPLTGGTPAVLYTDTASGEIDTIALGATDVAFVVTILDTQTGGEQRTLYDLPKAGGAPVMLWSSQDTRSFLGVAFDGDNVLFSIDTELYSVPRTGATPKIAGESDGSVQYWIYSPVPTPDAILWASDDQLFRMPRSAHDGIGHPFASMPGLFESKIVGLDQKLVVALSMGFEEGFPADSFVEVDPATGALGSVVPLGVKAVSLATTDTDVWAGSFQDGVVRVSRTTGTVDHVTSAPTFAVAATPDAVFAATTTGVTRIAR